MVIGIDPGFTGAAAFLFDDGTLIIRDLPIKKIAGRKQIDGRRFGEWFTGATGFEVPRFVAIEDVHSMPNQGVASTFRFGYGAGIIRGVFDGLGFRVIPIKPAVWKSALGLGTCKKDSLALARKTFPTYTHYFRRAKDAGRAEAALIAHFAAKSF